MTVFFAWFTSCLVDLTGSLSVSLGEWSGKGAAPELTSCSDFKHLTYDDIKSSRQKLAPGKLVFSYGVEWRRSEVRLAFFLSLTLT